MPLHFHKMAQPAAKAALAAGEQGKFWEYHDKIFSLKKITEKDLVNIAKKLKLDMQKFEEDRDSFAIQQRVDQDIRDADEAGVTGTPTLFINGHRAAKRDKQVLQNMINAELKKLGLSK